jgi:antitoxin component YwqK of YwqJK toxin-antitoxin module
MVFINTSIGQNSPNLKVIKNYYDRPKNTRLEEIYTVNSIGQKQGNYKWYNIFSVTTTPEYEYNYNNGMLEGTSKRYYTFTQVSLSGIIKETCQYIADKKNGKEIFYDYSYNGLYASAYKDEQKIIDFIQKGKRVIREEMEYYNNIKISEKRYYANERIAVNQKFDNNGYLLLEELTNEDGLVTYENRFDNEGNFIRKFKLYPNGKLNIINEKDSLGGFSYKEYYETGIIKKEQGLDKSDKILFETNYDINGKILRKTTGLNVDDFFSDGTLKEHSIYNKNKEIIENVVYSSPGKMQSKYVLNSDGSTIFKKFDENNECNYTYEVDKNKNSIKNTKTKSGGYIILRSNAFNENLGIEEYDALGKLISKEIRKPAEDKSGNIITTKIIYNKIGGYLETILYNNPYESDKFILQSTKEVDSIGAFKLTKYTKNGLVYQQSTFDYAGRINTDSNSNKKVFYDTTGNKAYERRYYNDGYEEYKYLSDGTIRYKTVTNNSSEKYPPESILSKFSQSWQKNIKLATIYFDEQGNKVKLKIFDAAGDIIKEIKIKNNDELQYSNFFLKVN